jgi:multidrug efflux system membrane fusion protein
VPVSIATATQEAVPIEIRAVGTAEASAVIQVKSQIAGELMRVAFVEGGNVNKGDLLFEIDPRPYQQALRQAQAAISRDEAQLRQAEANLARDTAQSKTADADAWRYAQLAKDHLISTSQEAQYRTTSETLRESVRADQAAIESARASLESDRAAVDRAKLDLSYCEIRSPVAGRAGNLLIQAGNLVAANGPNPLVVINQLTPIFASFGAPEEYLAAVRRNSAARKLAVTATPQNDPTVEATGVLTVIDNTVDTNTGTIRLKATFDNRTRVLWPGEFLNVALTLDTKNAIVVPSEAVQAGQQGQMVYVVKSNQTVEPRVITVGATYGKKVIVETGVAAGETVVTDGQLRLFPGARIQAVPAGKIDSQAL